MARIVEEVISIRFSKIVKDTEPESIIASSDIRQALEQVAQELVGEAVIVEVVTA